MELQPFRNKDVIQSYIFTTAKYNYSVYEKRIIYRLVEMVQNTLEGQKLDKGFSIERTLYDDRIITMPISAFLVDDQDKNYQNVKDTLRRMRNKTFEYINGSKWKLIGIIEKPNFDTKGIAQFELQPEVYDALLDFSKGFRKYELKTAMMFESGYSMRFYELMSNQKKPLTYGIQELKDMFGISDKYTRINDFMRYVIDVAQKELTEKSPYTFTYKRNKTGRFYTSITFYPISQPSKRDPDLERKDLQKQTNVSWLMDRNTSQYLKDNFDFTSNEIKQNSKLFEVANKHLDLIQLMADVKPRANRANNPKGYLINSIKLELGAKDIVFS